jgi:hypothetical protein
MDSIDDLVFDVIPVLRHAQDKTPAGIQKGHYHTPLRNSWIPSRATPDWSGVDVGISLRTLIAER